MKKIKLFILATIFSISGSLLIAGISSAGFNRNRLIDDTIFDASGTMNAVQIDNFLNGFSSSCISPNSGFEARVPSGYSPSGGFTYGNFGSAGQVIATAAQVYGINPRVLIVTLEKEQSLVTGRNNFNGYCMTTSQHKYAAAMGYGCPDSGGSYSYSGISLYRRNGVERTSVSSTCVNSSAKAGFSQQVIRAAWLLKFGQQRSKGNINWAVITGSWDNSDDLQSYYSGPMTQGTFQRCSSCQAAYYDGYITIDNTATHMDTGGTAALYWYTPHFHGNENFVDLFTNWFGSTTLPYAFKSPNSSTIYYYVNGFKVAVNAMATLQDYGISPQSIQTLDQATIDSIPTPDPSTDGISPNLSYLIKSSSDSDADGGSVYLISVGKKYKFKTMQQFFEFGYNESDISYMPISFILSFSGSQFLSNYIKSPHGTVFQVTSAQKKLIFDYDKYISLNPSDQITYTSYYLTDLLPSGDPLSSRDILVKRSSGDTVYLFNGGNYYSIPTFSVYSCWGFETTLHTPLYRLPNNSYVAAINPDYALDCLVKNASSLSLLNGSLRYSIPAAYGLTRSQNDNQDIIDLSNKIPGSAAALKQYIKPSNSAGVWYLSNGVRKLVPTYSNFVLLGLDNTKIDTLDASVFPSLPASGIKLGNGQVVKTDSSGAVYVVSDNARILYATSDSFLAYRNNWSSIETYPATVLNQEYPYSGDTVNLYLFDSASNKVYLVDINGCYLLDTNMVNSYGQNQTNLANNQGYGAGIFINLKLSICHAGSYYIKQAGQSLVYWMDGGSKHPINSWDKLVNHSGQSNPYVITLSASTMSTFPTGTPL
jgi:hypothetical protein